VIGYMPGFLASEEVAHPRLSYLEIVGDLMERKRKMIDQADAFVIFPGGIGTLDEALEVITHKILRQFEKPIAFFNPEGFWDLQLKFLDQLSEQGMLDPVTLQSFEVFDRVPELIQYLSKHEV
jgi:uncharacterized protein (TIGR00730 family)